MLQTIEFGFRRVSSTRIFNRISFTKHRQLSDGTEFISESGIIISLSTERPVLAMVGTPAQQFANMKTIWTSIGLWPRPMEERYLNNANFWAAFQFESDPEKLLAGFWGEKLELVFITPDEPSQISAASNLLERKKCKHPVAFLGEAESLGADHELACKKFYEC